MTWLYAEILLLILYIVFYFVCLIEFEKFAEQLTADNRLSVIVQQIKVTRLLM